MVKDACIKIASILCIAQVNIEYTLIILIYRFNRPIFAIFSGPYGAPADIMFKPESAVVLEQSVSLGVAE
jgi:hypothetical protein